VSFSNKSIQMFLDELASAEPVPGGGTVAALSGALGASLVAMVCRLTIGKKNYEAVSAEMQTILSRAEALQRELTDWMQADTDAYARVMDAYKLPKTTEAEKAARSTGDSSRAPARGGGTAARCRMLRGGADPGVRRRGKREPERDERWRGRRADGTRGAARRGVQCANQLGWHPR
jgi:hypothetical protein